MKNKVSKILIRATALALLAAPFSVVEAQEVYSATIGAVAVKVPGESDIMVALPFKQEKAAGGLVSAVDASVVSFGASTMTAGEFDTVAGEATHYAYVEDGTWMGRSFDIVSNTTSALTLDASDLSNLNDSSISIRSHWTLGTLFPDGVGSKSESSAGLRDVEVIIPDLTSVGGGIAASRIFYFYEDAWREVGRPLTESLDSVVVDPGTSFVIRNNGDSDVDYFFFGEVEYGPLAIPLVSGTEVVDNFVAVARPLGITISELGLADPIFGANDRLLVYSTVAGSKNITPVSYLFNGTTWQEENGDGSDAGDTLIKAGQGIAIRMAAADDGTNFWVNQWEISQ